MYKWGSENLAVWSSFIWVSDEKPSSSYSVMWYFWWGCRGNLKLITLYRLSRNRVWKETEMSAHRFVGGFPLFTPCFGRRFVWQSNSGANSSPIDGPGSMLKITRNDQGLGQIYTTNWGQYSSAQSLLPQSLPDSKASVFPLHHSQYLYTQTSPR